MRGYSRSLALLCCRPAFGRKLESCTPLTVCYTVQRSGAHRDSLEQFGQQLSLWLLLASLSDPCHNSVTSSQSKFHILFLLSIGKSNSISFNVVINDASYFLHTSARCLIGKPSVSEVWQQSLVIPHNVECLPSLKCLATCYIFHTVYILYLIHNNSCADKTNNLCPGPHVKHAMCFYWHCN